MTLAAGCEQAANVLLILARQRCERHFGPTTPAAGQNYVAVVDAFELRFFGYLSIYVAPIARFRHDPRWNKAWTPVVDFVRLRLRLVAWRCSRLANWGAKGHRGLFDLF